VTVAARLVRTLRAGAVDRIYCVPGESFVSLLDALRDEAGIDVVTCRHEAAAAHMAAADARLTGRTGVCVVSRWPGATHASIGVHAAAADAVPLLLIVGHVPTVSIGRFGYQEADYRLLFGDVAKRVSVLHDARNTAELTAQALRLAAAGTPGPTVLVVPEDVFDDADPPAGREHPGAEPWWQPAPAEVPAATLARTRELLDRSARPLLVAGGALDTVDGRRAVRAVAERHQIPVVASNKHQDLLDSTHPCYAGHLFNATPAHQRRMMAETDLVIAAGTRLDRITTQDCRLPEAPVPRQPLVHVHSDAMWLGMRHSPAVAVAADPAAFLAAVAAAPRGNAPDRNGWVGGLHELEHRWATAVESDPGGITLSEVLAELNALGAGDMIVTADAGTFTRAVHRHIRVKTGRLLATASGAMGFGLPAAVAAALRVPGRTVVCVVGDGGLLMSGGDLATAVAHGLRLLLLVVNNDAYATIRRHQERRFPGRAYATSLSNPDFVGLATAYGAVGLRIRDRADARPVLAKALAAGCPALVELRTGADR
jgi:acetolactate synthase I/II/III large subunit